MRRVMLSPKLNRVCSYLTREASLLIGETGIDKRDGVGFFSEVFKLIEFQRISAQITLLRDCKYALKQISLDEIKRAQNLNDYYTIS